jgi:CSLREA domain-containing protein
MKIRLLFLIIVLLFVLVLGGRQTPAAQAYAPLVVDTLIDEKDGKCDDGDCSLRDAIDVVPDGAAIEIPISGTIELDPTLDELIISRSMMIRGSGPKLLTISGQDTIRVFNIGSGKSVTISDLTIANGYTDENGGGIYNRGYLNLANCTILNNTAEQEGGGVYNRYNTGILDVKSCSFIGNHALNGGGLKNDSARATLGNCTFSGNVAENRGGGIDSDKEGDNAPSNVDMKNCTFSGNTNGGVTNLSSTTTAINTIIAGNLGYDCQGGFASGTTFNLASDITCTPGFAIVTLQALGFTWDGWMYQIKLGSKALDTGTETGCLKVDQIETLRPQDGNGDGEAVCDIGAHEKLPLPPPVMSLFLPLARK